MSERLDELVTQKITAAPTDPCLWWRGDWWSCGAFGEMIEESEKNLRESGFSVGQRLALLLPNSPILLASCIAAWRLGGSVVPVNPQLRSSSLRDYLRKVDVFGAIVSEEEVGLASELDRVGVPASSASLNDAAPPIEGGKGEPDDTSEIAVLFQTAGVSGNPKAVPITHRGILAILSSILELVPAINEDDVILNAIPNYHSLGFVVGGALPLAFGMPQVTLPSFMPPKTALAAIRSAEVTIIPAVPMMLSVLLGGERSASPLSKLKMVFYGGGKLTPGVTERAREFFGVELLEGYGLTEASSVLAVTPDESATKPGSSGRILPCFDVQVRDEAGNALPFGAEGRLWIRGEPLAKGYYRSPEISAERFRDGWFDAQDIVRIDEEGYITIVSPAVDVITVGGVSVYPAEIEAVLREHPDVEDAAVIGVTGGIKGEAIRAFVVLSEGAGMRPRDLISYCRTKLPNYKVPRSIEFLPELPKNSLGNVMKKELRGV